MQMLQIGIRPGSVKKRCLALRRSCSMDIEGDFHGYLFCNLLHGEPVRPGVYPDGDHLCDRVCGASSKRPCKEGHRVVIDAALLWAAGVVFDSIVHGLGFDTYMEDARMLFQLVLYAALLKSCPKMMAVLRGSMYFACMNLILPVSEPMGDLFKAVFSSFHYADTLTPIIVGASCAFTVWFAHRFSPKNLLHLPWLSAITMAIVSAMGWTLWRLSRYTQPGRLYSLVVAAAFYALVYLFYYMLCLISLESENNERLKAMEQKMAMDHELIETSRANYEEMHEIRHETKNHLIYLKSLAYHGEWDRLWEYLNQLSTRTDEMFTFIECGNDVVNAVMNHAVSQAKHLVQPFVDNSLKYYYTLLIIDTIVILYLHPSANDIQCKWLFIGTTLPVVYNPSTGGLLCRVLYIRPAKMERNMPMNPSHIAIRSPGSPNPNGLILDAWTQKPA